jgi:hypothetical protein
MLVGIVIDMRKSTMTASKMLARRVGDFNIDAINELTEMDRAWMAGFFDGEGSVGLYRKKKDGEFYAVTTRITIAQTDRRCLEPFFAAFGGSLSLVNRPDRAASRHTQYWAWHCENTAGANVFLQTLRPYMRVKAAEADLVIEYLAHRYDYSLSEKGLLIDRLAQLKVRKATHMDQADVDERAAKIRAIENDQEVA